MITLVKIIQTCSACPSQWDAWDAEGNYYYLRYRWGHGSVVRAPSKEEMTYESERVAEFESGDSLDGCIDLEAFAELAGVTVDAVPTHEAGPIYLINLE